MAVREAPTHRTIGGFVLGARLGRGGAGEVYAARHPAHGETLAVKLVMDLHAPDADARRALADEAARARAILHPAVVRVIDVGYDAEVGIAYLAMERIAGEDLGSRLKRDLLEDAEARGVFGAIAEGMAAVHAAGLVHRDLKPANVMLRDGAPIIVDFGIARVVGESGVHVTRRRMGTIEYMAPEQLASGLVAPSVDIWAFGVMLFEAVTGELPFRGFADGRMPQLFETPPRAMQIAAAHGLAPISHVLDDLIARCLTREPSRRPPSMAAIARELAGAAPLADAASEDRITQDVGGPPVGFARPSVAPIASDRSADDRATSIDPPGGRRLPTVARPAPSKSRSPMGFVIAAVAAAIIGIVAAQLVTRSSRTATTSSAAAGSSSSQAVAHGAGPSVEDSDVRPPDSAPAIVDVVTDDSAPVDEPVDVAMPADPMRHKPPKPAGALVEVISVPSGATIYVLGEKRGTTPAKVQVFSSTTIEVKKPGYKPASSVVGSHRKIRVKLVPIPHSEGLD